MKVREFLNLAVSEQKIIAIPMGKDVMVNGMKLPTCTLKTKDNEIKHEELLDLEVLSIYAVDEDMLSICIK